MTMQTPLRNLRIQHYDGAVATFGDRLKELRGDLSQEKLAAKLGHKRPSTVQGWERGKIPKPAMLKKIAKALGVEPSALLEGVLTPYDRARGEPVCLLIAHASLLPVEAQAELADTARQLCAHAGKQWRDVPASARKRGILGKARTSRQ